MLSTKTLQPQSDLIRDHIDRLHQRGDSNWQRLLTDVERHTNVIPLNTAQALAAYIGDQMPSVKNIDLEWGRGTGKTSVTAFFTRRILTDLPRGHFQWLVPTYQKFLTEIIPAYIHGLEMHGLYKDLHYFVGRRAPASWKWPESYKPPQKYDNAIHFFNGFTISLLSQDVKGSGRGPSYDGKFADETTMLNVRQMQEESDPSIRGSNVREFVHRRYFDFRLMASSTATTLEGEWFINRETLAIEDPKKYRFLRANCLCNMHNLKPGYLEDARKEAIELWRFEAEYLNIRPKLTRGGFYGLLNADLHTYTAYNYGHYANQIGAKPDCRGDSDLNAALPLIFGMDWGAAINSLVVGQHQGNEFRALKEFFTLGMNNETQDDLIDKFCDYYQYHATKVIYMYYDATGNAATGNTKLTRAKQAELLLLQRGWKVIRHTIAGTNPHHFAKYQLWAAILAENNPVLPRFRMNKANCPSLWISMSKAKTKQGDDGVIKKDKSGERADNPQRQYATDLSDAVDQPVFSMFNQLFQSGGGLGITR